MKEEGIWKMAQKNENTKKPQEEVQELIIDFRQHFIDKEEFFKRFKMLHKKFYSHQQIIENYDRAMKGI